MPLRAKVLGLGFFIMSLFFSVSAQTSEENLLSNGDFEEIQNGLVPDFWSFESWTGKSENSFAEFDDKVAKSGKISLRINNLQKDDSKLVQKVRVEPETWYRFSVWIKTEGVGSEKKGANITVIGISDSSDDVQGTQDWTYREVYGFTGPEQREIALSLRLGGYSNDNTGTAWFDDVRLQKVREAPQGKKTMLLYARSNDAVFSEALAKGGGLWLAFLITLAFCALAWYFVKNPRPPRLLSQSDSSGHRLLLAALILGGIVKAILAGLYRGYGADISTFSAWAIDVFNRGPANFYQEGYFADYPPGYLYFLWLLGATATLLKIPTETPAFYILLKLPSIAADLVSVYVIFRIAHKGEHLKLAFGLGLLYLFNPLVTMVSSIWGQVDSIFTLCLVLALYCLELKKLPLAAALYAFSILLKPQALLIAPLALLALVREGGGLKTILVSLGAFLGTAVVFVLPFALGKDPGWIFSLYGGTLGSYPYISLNAFNLYTLFGLNWRSVNDPGLFGLNLQTLAWVLTVLGMIWALFLAYRSKLRGRYAYAAYFIFLCLFVVGPKMHERYLYPAALLAVLSFLLLKDRRILITGFLVSISAYLNIFVTLDFMTKENSSMVPPNNFLLLLLSLLNVLTLAWAVKIGVDIFLREKIRPFSEEPKPVATGVPGSRSKTGPGDAAPAPLLTPRIEEPGKKLTRTDGFLIGGLTLVYAVTAFWGLGSTIGPQKYWDPLNAGEYGIFDLGESTDIGRLDYFIGLGKGSYRLQWSDDGESWVEGEAIVNDNPFAELRWRSHNNPVKARFLKISLRGSQQQLNELVLWDKNVEHPLPPPTLVQQVGSSSSPEALFDEQISASKISNYYNGMYFDEIYHARSAWEYLQGKDATENTHPPLGKLIIASGVAIFGMNPFGYRFMGTFFGVLMIPLFYLLAFRLFRSGKWAFLAATLFAFDFMHFAQTRIATIDTYGVFFILLSYYFMLRYTDMNFHREKLGKTFVPLLLCGIAFGLGAASKWIVLYAAFGLAVFFFVSLFQRYKEYRLAGKELSSSKKTRNSKKRQGAADGQTGIADFSGSVGLDPAYVRAAFGPGAAKTLLFAVLCFIVIPLTLYTLSYLPFMSLPSPGHGIAGVVANQQSMWSYHANIKDSHPFSSQWYEWPLMIRPIWYYSGSSLVSPTYASGISAFGNPVVWWLGSLAFLALSLSALFILFVRGAKLFVPKLNVEELAGRDPARFRIFLFVLVGGLAQFLPWALIPRKLVFIYHFFASVPFIVLALVYFLKDLEERSPEKKWPRILPWAVAVLALLLFVWFYPVLSGVPAPRWWVEPLRWFNSWALF